MLTDDVIIYGSHRNWKSLRSTMADIENDNKNWMTSKAHYLPVKPCFYLIPTTRCTHLPFGWSLYLFPVPANYDLSMNGGTQNGRGIDISQMDVRSCVIFLASNVRSKFETGWAYDRQWLTSITIAMKWMTLKHTVRLWKHVFICSLAWDVLTSSLGGHHSYF